MCITILFRKRLPVVASSQSNKKVRLSKTFKPKQSFRRRPRHTEIFLQNIKTNQQRRRDLELSMHFCTVKSPDAFQLLSCLDYTTLQGTDTQTTVETHCRRIINLKEENPQLPWPAAVCVLPVFIPTAKKWLENTPVRVATVAGDFPLGQLPPPLKLEQVRYAVDQGADEVDFVVSRRLIFEGRFEEFAEDIRQAADMCRRITFKVILETGEIQDVVLIKRAANLAIKAGADFLKTSTGRASVNATPESVQALSEVVRDHFLATGRKVGIKPAGGIRTLSQAQNLAGIILKTCGKDWLQPAFFRIGASALLDSLIDNDKASSAETQT